MDSFLASFNKNEHGSSALRREEPPAMIQAGQKLGRKKNKKEVFVASMLLMNEPCALTASKASHMLSYINRTISTARRLREVIYASLRSTH